MDVIKTVQMMKIAAAKYPRAHTKLIEEGANGIAVIQLLSQKMSGILGIKPRDSKIARVVAISPQIEAGNVHIPHPDFATFPVEDFVDEFTAFPRGSHDDQVDACSQALDRLSRSENNYLRKLLRKD
jgi:predicted phage terminase large subunit-like protein